MTLSTRRAIDDWRRGSGPMRIDYKQHLSIVRPMRELGQAGHEGSLEPILMELVKVRASQLNRCAHCLEMHTKDARAMGESDDRLHLVAAWREAPVFSERERAALRWCEELTPPGRAERPRRALRRDPSCLLGRRALSAHPGHRHDQRLEPVRGRIPCAGGELRAPGARRGRTVIRPCEPSEWTELAPAAEALVATHREPRPSSGRMPGTRYRPGLSQRRASPSSPRRDRSSVLRHNGLDS